VEQVTEEEWLTCKEPDKMLAHLGVDQHWGMVQISPNSWAPSNKKNKLDNPLRLFACACCRRIWDQITEETGRKAVEIAEAFANGQATAKQLRDASIAAGRCMMEDEEILDEGIDSYLSNLAIIATMQTSAKPFNPLNVSENAAQASANAEAEKAAQCRLLRDIVGSPFKSNAR
jgi:hypothetical protein